MKKKAVIDKHEEKRSEPRTVLDKYYSVEFKLPVTGQIYHFKLRDISSKGLSILVNEDSAVLEHLKTGDILDMKYYFPDAASPSEILKTRVIHITKRQQEPFKGHFLIGLSIIAKQNLDNNTGSTK